MLSGIYLTSDEDVPIEKYASIDLQAGQQWRRRELFSLEPDAVLLAFLSLCCDL